MIKSKTKKRLIFIRITMLCFVCFMIASFPFIKEFTKTTQIIGFCGLLFFLLTTLSQFPVYSTIQIENGIITISCRLVFSRINYRFSLADCTDFQLIKKRDKSKILRFNIKNNNNYSIDYKPAFMRKLDFTKWKYFCKKSMDEYQLGDEYQVGIENINSLITAELGKK